MRQRRLSANRYRLLRTVEPLHYHLIITPDFSSLRFSGVEQVSLLIKKSTSQITLHSVGLKISKVCLVVNGGNLTPQCTSFDKKLETVTFKFGKRVPAGEAELFLSFFGELNDKMHGFYRTSYEVNGEKKWGGATQFEATDARRAFPCFDEPDRKATFSLELIVPKEKTALSNMPVGSVEEGHDIKMVRYQKTPPMSTYLLAWVVADLECFEALDKNRVPIRVWTTLGKKEQGRFALDTACRVLPYFAEWFGVPYALPKLDMVALPDFAAGAMENWGLVTYRETALLIDRDNSSQAAKQRVAEIVSHELAHQWFGNYVTMKWWTHLWLNEGFASYMGPKAVNHIFPDWDIWTQYVADDYCSALHLDGLKNTHPVEVGVGDPREISEVFDAISYSKGSVINRMLEHYLGEELFRRGLRHYLTRYAYKNAATDDLWKALEEVSGKPIKEIMASFTRQPGYPVLKVQRARGGLRISQERFIFDGSKDKKDPLWKVPFGVAYESDPEPIFFYLDRRSTTIPLELDDGEWVKVNPDQSGFYRVSYAPELMGELKRVVGTQTLSKVDKLELLDDALALAKAGLVKTSDALGLLASYSKEEDFSVWSVLAASLGTLDNLLGREAFYGSFVVFAKEFFTPAARLIGWDKKPGDGHLEVMLRSLLLLNAGWYGDRKITEEAQRRFQEFVAGGTLNPDIRQAVYTLSAENGGGEELEALLKIYDSTDLQEEKMRVLRSLAGFRDGQLLRQVLQFSLSERVRAQDTPILIAGIGSHSVGRSAAWDFVKRNWKKLLGRYEGSGLGLLSMMVEFAAGFSSEEELRDVAAFFRKERRMGLDRTKRQVLESIRSKIKWLRRDRQDIEEWLRSRADYKLVPFGNR